VKMVRTTKINPMLKINNNLLVSAPLNQRGAEQGWLSGAEQGWLSGAEATVVQ
jgi:hypothetical protein